MGIWIFTSMVNLEIPGVKTWEELEFLLTMGKNLLFLFYL